MKKIKKGGRGGAFLSALVLIFALGSCSSEQDRGITVISREEGSGTRSAFTELFGALDQNKADAIAPTAEITNNTAVMMTSVAGNKNAVGYISLGSLNDSVKALAIDGVAATAQNAANGSYKIVRPFYVAIKEGTSPQALDFIDFILSREGQDIIQANGCVRQPDTGPFSGGRASGRVIVAGSSSVTPVMEKLREAYLKLNPGASIEIQQSDSSTGMNAAIEGICDIGMASRELRSSETDKGLRGIQIAIDGIAVIVHKENTVSGLTREQVKAVFLGETTTWEALSR
jgi:phosphate transport system substrate-binding protein